jgi:CRISPR/Cas system-associated protein Csm6
MPNDESKRKWEQQFREAATHLEEDLRRFSKYINDEIVPDVRRNGSEALRAAAAELHKLAQRMDDHARRTPPSPPPPPPDARKP